MTSNQIYSHLRRNPDFLAVLSEQTEEFCLAAVLKDGLALRHVRCQTFEICLAAVEQNGEALQYVTEQTPEISRAAVMQNGLALRFVENQTIDICLEAIRQNELAELAIHDAFLFGHVASILTDEEEMEYYKPYEIDFEKEHEWYLHTTGYGHSDHED